MTSVAVAVFGVATLAACTGQATEAGDVSDNDQGVAEATMMTAGNTQLDWLTVEEGRFEGYGFIGNLYCPDETYPVELDANTKAEFKGDGLYLSFEADQVPPGVVMAYSGDWLVASFDTEGATEYFIKTEVANVDYMEGYAQDPTWMKTCWQ